MKKTLLIIKYIGFVVLVAVFASVIGLFTTRAIVRSSHLQSNKIDTSVGIDDMFTLEIGGITQYFHVRGEDKNNPLILFLHGGPGSPVTPLIYLYQHPWESFATIVNWDQRNAGKTYFLNDPNQVYGTLTLDRMIEDTYEIVEAMKEKYHQEILILMGHSWGSLLGTVYALTYPETIAGYIGTGQLIHAAEGDQLAVEQAIIKAEEQGASKDADALRGLENYSLSDSDFQQSNFNTMRHLTSKYLSPDTTMPSLWQLFVSPYYQLKELQFFLLNSSLLQKPLLDILAYDFDARTYGVEYQVPVYYISGSQDWYTPTVLVSAYYDTILAPKKQAFIIEKAGHMLMVDQVEEYATILGTIIEDILEGISN